MKRVWLAVVLAAACSVWVAAQDVDTVPASGPDEPSAFMTERQAGFDLLAAGNFRAGLGHLKKAQTLRPDSTLIARACTLAAAHLDAVAGSKIEKEQEYAAAVQRVRLARLAEEHRPALVESGSAEGLFSGVEAVADALLEADKQLGAQATTQPANLADAAGKSLSEAMEKLAATLAEARGAPAAWREAFEGAGQRCRSALDAYRKAWETARLPADRMVLKRSSEGVRDALIDMGVLVSRDPLLVALSHARDARGLSDEPEKFFELEWVRQLVGQAEARGNELLKQGEWTKALSVYGRTGLVDLDENSADYEETVKRVSQHVRAISLYGGDDGVLGAGEGVHMPNMEIHLPSEQEQDKENPEEDPEDNAEDGLSDEPRWKEMTQRIDTVMVRNAIKQIDENYVEAPDYRKIALSALEGIGILVETPQAAATFESLRDEGKKQRFQEGLAALVDRLTKEPTPDHISVTEALNRTLDLNAETLDLPSEVINMEFADAMVGRLDKFTSMIWPYEIDEFRKRTIGSFFGIGVQIRKDTGGPIEVVSPLPDTPAFRAGIQAGDWIIRVNGKETRAMSLNSAVKKITGPRHTTVTLTIQRTGTVKPFDVPIVRDEIRLQTVKGWRHLGDGSWDFMIDPDMHIGYVRLTQFTRDTTGELDAALDGLREAGVSGVILDLRFNPGGLLDVAEQVSDEFLRRGVIVSTKGRNVSEPSRMANSTGRYLSGRLIVLINQYSASASEIVAGALKDWGRAKIIGERTYGKGSVQKLISLMGGGEAQLKLTTAYYYLPSGTCLHRTNGAKVWGVDPDLAVKETVRQTNRWAEIRQETDVLKDVDAGQQGVLLDQQLGEDLQLKTALLLLRLRVLQGT